MADGRIRRELLVITTDFTIYVAVLGAWYAYKESSWIIALVLMVPMYFLGCIISIGYILTQFYKLSPEESSTDPLYFVLARRQKSMWLDILTLLFLKNIGHRDVVGYLDTGRHSVVAARVIYSALGCVAFGTLTYSVYVDLSPSYIKYFTSCILTNGTDMYIHVVIFSVWLAYKESSNWITAFFWILLLFCFRGYGVSRLNRLDINFHEALAASSCVWRQKPNVIQKCKQTPNVTNVTQVHALAFKVGVVAHLPTATSLVIAYARAGRYTSSVAVFCEVFNKDVVVWNAMMTCAVENGKCFDAMRVFMQMLRGRVEFDSVTLVIVVSNRLACLQCVHSLGLKFGLLSDTDLCNALINAYAKCGELCLSENMFVETEVNDIVSLNSMISGCLSNDRPDKALWYFKKMVLCGAKS
ncbi:Pentatricopeptide repeat-containing protein [Artemisia annua]|uniref:Pentatricopeptide repeat-containing protein n=1 Tax=Artemisia annua TaxID=35608 RepID=A0A2U1Q171_ARTAN|nr:Pentatricopeptide repeat-containing protein [Artemisia annua]